MVLIIDIYHENASLSRASPHSTNQRKKIRNNSQKKLNQLSALKDLTSQRSVDNPENV